MSTTKSIGDKWFLIHRYIYLLHLLFLPQIANHKEPKLNENCTEKGMKIVRKVVLTIDNLVFCAYNGNENS